MSPGRQADPDPDTLIDEITVDSHDEDEHLMGFETAFDEDASFPCHGTVIGEEVEVLSVSRADNRSGSSPPANERTPLRSCTGRHHINADATTSRLIAAYRRWPGN